MKMSNYDRWQYMHKHCFTRFTLALMAPVLLVWALVTAVALPRAAYAVPNAIITVTTLDDEQNNDGDCSLREALAAANSDAAVDACTPGSGADTISFGALTGTIVLSSTLGDLEISSNVTIAGGGVITVSGNNSVRVFNITAGHVTFDGLTIANGNVQTNDCGPYDSIKCGGGIMVQNSSF